jgi:hypothetical protein
MCRRTSDLRLARQHSFTADLSDAVAAATNHLATTEIYLNLSPEHVIKEFIEVAAGRVNATANELAKGHSFISHTLNLTNHPQPYFKAVFGSCLVIYAIQVVLDRLFSDKQRRGDFLIPEAGRHAWGYLPFTFGQSFP